MVNELFFQHLEHIHQKKWISSFSLLLVLALARKKKFEVSPQRQINTHRKNANWNFNQLFLSAVDTTQINRINFQVNEIERTQCQEIAPINLSNKLKHYLWLLFHSKNTDISNFTIVYITSWSSWSIFTRKGKSRPSACIQFRLSSGRKNSEWFTSAKSIRTGKMQIRISTSIFIWWQIQYR